MINDRIEGIGDSEFQEPRIACATARPHLGSRMRGRAALPYRGRALSLAVVLLVTGVVLHASSRPAEADTIVLKDGSVIDGEILSETRTIIRVKTVHGVRTYKKKDIEQILDPRIELTDLEVDHFDALPETSKQILNARALYAMGEYDEAMNRVAPLMDKKGRDWNQMLIRWLLIESNERLGKFEKAKELLEYVMEHGGPEDRTRAEAHLSIFKDNPDYSLRVIGTKFARYFLDEEMERRAKAPNALAQKDIMEAALKEYCDQILENDRISVEAFRRRLSVNDTVRALDEANRSRGLPRELPYLDELHRVEVSLQTVQMVLPGYADAYELDLIRTEAEHMLDVIDVLFNRALQANPENFNPPSDATTGLLTPDGRQQWRERCEEFLEISKPAEEMMEYLLVKLERYPKDLRTLNKIYSTLLSRLQEMRQLAIKRKDRARV